MKINLIAATLVGSALFLGGCDEKKDPMADAAAKMKDSATKAADATKDAATKAADATKDAANKAADSVKGMLDGKMKDAVQSYTADLAKLGDSLGGIKSVEDATKAFPGLKDQMAKVSGYVATLSAAPADVKTKIMADFKPQIESAVKKFKDQADRITKDGMLSKVPGLADSIKNFKLFE